MNTRGTAYNRQRNMSWSQPMIPLGGGVIALLTAASTPTTILDKSKGEPGVCAGPLKQVSIATKIVKHITVKL